MKKLIILILSIMILFGCAPVYKIPVKSGSFSNIPTIRIALRKTEPIEIKGNDIHIKTASESYSGNSIKITNSSVTLDGKTINTNFPIEISSEEDILSLNNKKFKGEMKIYKNPQLLVVNKTDIETYLKGVVPCELRTKELNALKAQIIASRTFALNLLKPDSAQYDITAGVEAQVYKGVSAEVDFINEEIEKTCGLVCTYDGKLIEAKYSSSCGGKTANSKRSYLKSVSCMFCKNFPNYNWSVDFNKDAFFKKLAIEGTSLTIIDKNKSGRVKTAKITGSDIILSGEQIRAKLGLKSTFFNVKDEGDKIIINGRGYGHGIGMCQYGAVGMAKEGFDYKSILKHYYSDINIEKLY